MAKFVHEFPAGYTCAQMQLSQRKTKFTNPHAKVLNAAHGLKYEHRQFFAMRPDAHCRNKSPLDASQFSLKFGEVFDEEAASARADVGSQSCSIGLHICSESKLILCNVYSRPVDARSVGLSCIIGEQ